MALGAGESLHIAERRELEQRLSTFKGLPIVAYACQLGSHPEGSSLQNCSPIRGSGHQTHELLSRMLPPCSMNPVSQEGAAGTF